MSLYAITSVCWIPKGAPKVDPIQYELNDDVMQSLTDDMTNTHIGDVKMSKTKEINAPMSSEKVDDDDLMKILNMDDYDDDSDEGDDPGRFLEGHGNAALEDPDNDSNFGDDYDDEDVEDQKIRPTDSCVLVCNNNFADDEYGVEVYLFDEVENNLYVHHDFTLPAPPMTVTWLNCNPKPRGEEDTFGSYAAVGSMEPSIEIWNCDVMHPLEPVAVLGGYAIGKNGKPSKKLKVNSHTDAIACLAWHKDVPERLASGSGDKTIKLWNILEEKCVSTFKHHKNSVDCLDWNNQEQFILLSGSRDKTAHVIDVRAANAGVSFKVGREVESAKWNPIDANLFVTSGDNGTVSCFDVRNSAAPLWSVRAHEKACCVSMNYSVSTLFATSSHDKTIKIWDSNGSDVPQCIATRDLNVGKLFTLQFDKSSPFVLAAGGDGGALAIWDVMENITVNERYSNGKHILPEDHISLQKQGIQSKGLGPGMEGVGKSNKKKDEDSDSEDDDGEVDNMRMSMYKSKAMAEAEGYDGYEDEDEDMED